MLTILNKARYQRYLEMRDCADRPLTHELWLPMLLFGSLGAITWAIRGTDGWGGIDGTLLPGLTWGLLWYYLCYRRGVDARGIVLWLGLGIALGGELGYGQYVSWIQGRFHVGDDVMPVAPWVGYLWFFICGVGWAAPGGIVLGWALNSQVSVRRWLPRVFLMMILLALIFNLPLPFMGGGVITRLGEFFVRYAPGVLYPNAALGLYVEPLDSHLRRMVYTNTQNFAVLVWWLAALGAALRQRDRATLVSGVVIGFGFGFGFVVSALWCLGYSHAPGWIDWWKMWELHAGFNLGPLYAIVLYWAMRQVKSPHAPGATPKTIDDNRFTGLGMPERCVTLFMGFSGFALVFAAGVEYFFWTGLLLALFYPALLIAATYTRPAHGAELRKRVSLVYSVFLLVFMLFHGGVSRTGVFLELYSVDAVDQYAWPPGRIALFTPVAAILVLTALASVLRQCRMPLASAPTPTRLPERMTDLFAFIVLVGAVSIWPSKIGVFYALFLCLSLFAFTRINRRFDDLS